MSKINSVIKTVPNPIHLFKGLDGLTSDKYEASLLQHINLLTKNSWRKDCINSGIFIDLSQIRWVNIGAANQLVILVESALKNDVLVYIALPFTKLTRKQIASKKENQLLYENLRKQRTNANEFLKVIQFDIAIRCKHLTNSNEPFITEDYEFSKNIEIDRDYFFDIFYNKPYITISDETEIDKYNYRYIFPLTWLDCKIGFQSEKFEKTFDKILSEHDRGLSSIDVASLKNVIISELLKNVKEHSGIETNHALLSIGLFSTNSLIKTKGDHTVVFSNQIEYQYINWLKKNSINYLIEIYFGDSGNGIIHDDFINAFNKCHNSKIDANQKLEKYKILKWAFDKWSTRKEETIRGTKGLYRIGRIVSKYNGIFSIRTDSINGGFQKGGYDSQNWVDNSKLSICNHPGTFIQIKLCPYRETVKFNFSFEKSIHRNQWNSYKYDFKSYNTSHFVSWLRGLIDSNINILLILSFDNNLDIEKLQLTLQETLRYISDFRHPNGIVVYISNDLGESSLQEIVNSTNQLILKDFNNLGDQESLTPDFEKVYDPVLVLGKKNIYWYGGNQLIINILNEIYSTRKFVKSINKLDTFKNLSQEEKEKILLHFHNDTSMVIINKETIEFNFTNIIELFRHKLFKVIESKSIKKLICTPKLKIVENWIDIDKILQNNAVGYALAMNFMMLENPFTKDIIIKRDTKILIDNYQLFEIANSFAQLNNIPSTNIFCVSEDIDTSIPKRTQLFEVEDKVIIITSFVSSSETIRRMTKYALRDIANPLCILCLANYREYNIEELQTWNEITPIVSLYRKFDMEFEASKKVLDLSVLEELNKKFDSVDVYISPSHQNEKNILTDNVLQSELKQHFIKTKSLYYSHVGAINGRHFTFYINKERLLENESILWNSVFACINDWKQTNKLGNFTLVQPEIVRGGHIALSNCINTLKQSFPNIQIVNWSMDNPTNITDTNIVYFDFGSLTGKSINKFLTSVRNAKSILICIVFSQFQNNELDFYNSIEKVRITHTIMGNSIQIALPFADDDIQSNSSSLKRQTKTADIEIKHLFNFPIKLYNSTTCPICEHEKSLGQYRGNDNYNMKFAIDRVQKLQIRKREDLSSIPTDFYFTNKINQHELSSILIMEMYELSLILDKSIYNTQYRVKLFKYIFSILKNKEKQLVDHNSQMYALLFIISLEVNWVQKEPLVFREFRYMISEIAAFIAKIEVSTLVQLFSKDENSITPLNLAVRYKFAAITVFRSSNKFNFCKNISNIILSSIYDNRYRNNLVQNTLYHINSIHKNSYNKSEEYFNNIKIELDNVLKSPIEFSTEQKAAIANIITNNEIVKEKLYWARNSIKSSMQVIMHLKDKIDADYYKRSHPLPVKYFEYLDFRKLGVQGDAWLDFKLQRTDSIFFELFKEKQIHLLDKWISASDFIKIIVYQYLKDIENTILKSELFYSSQHYWTRMPNVITRFSQLINLVSDDVVNLIPFFEEYHNLYDFMYDAVIKYEKEEQPDSSDSKLLYFLKNLPSNIYNEINDIYSKNEFKQTTISEDKKIKVFYPKAQLNENLLHIKNNIVNKLNPDNEIGDVSIEINIIEENQFVVIEIKNDCTDKYDKQNGKGGLNDFKNDLSLYGGVLDYFLDKKQFVIKLKILKYERI